MLQFLTYIVDFQLFCLKTTTLHVYGTRANFLSNHNNKQLYLVTPAPSSPLVRPKH